jgi:hypothetical protein
VFSGDIPHLQPERESLLRLLVMTGNLEQAVSQEGDDAAMVRWAELPVDGQAEHVPLEGL